jgi:hypothetical protein
MAAESKKQAQQQLIDRDGEQLLRSRLPRHWVLREYRPDFGLDFALEIFSPPNRKKRFDTYETLGEHLFIQLKSVKSASSKPLQLYGRTNVEKQREVLNKKDLIGEVQTVRLSLETSELVTVERMGVGVPVLLVVADLSSSRCFFVCLNDYIDKILMPRYSDYRSNASRTIHVPVLNEVGTPDFGQVALRWYAKRAKLYAAFQRFVFQAGELNYAWHTPEGSPMAECFASRILSYDFWYDTEMWSVIANCGAAVQRFLSTGSPGLKKCNEEAILMNIANRIVEDAEEIVRELKQNEVPDLWRLLSLLPRNYEDVCREWYLPTAVGFTASPSNWASTKATSEQEVVD